MSNAFYVYHDIQNMEEIYSKQIGTTTIWKSRITPGSGALKALTFLKISGCLICNFLLKKRIGKNGIPPPKAQLKIGAPKK